MTLDELRRDVDAQEQELASLGDRLSEKQRELADSQEWYESLCRQSLHDEKFAVQAASVQPRIGIIRAQIHGIEHEISSKKAALVEVKSMLEGIQAREARGKAEEKAKQLYEEARIALEKRDELYQTMKQAEATVQELQKAYVLAEVNLQRHRESPPRRFAPASEINAYAQKTTELESARTKALQDRLLEDAKLGQITAAWRKACSEFSQRENVYRWNQPRPEPTAA